MSSKIDRRSFLGKVGGGTAACILALQATGCDGGVIDTGPIDGVTVNGNTVEIDLNAPGTSALNNDGGFLLIGGARVFVTRSGGELKAMTSVCPHEQFDVNEFKDGRVICSSGHPGVFFPDGVRDPDWSRNKPRSNLTPYSLSQVGDIVTIITT